MILEAVGVGLFRPLYQLALVIVLNMFDSLVQKISEQMQHVPDRNEPNMLQKPWDFLLHMGHIRCLAGLEDKNCRSSSRIGYSTYPWAETQPTSLALDFLTTDFLPQFFYAANAQPIFQCIWLIFTGVPFGRCAPRLVGAPGYSV